MKGNSYLRFRKIAPFYDRGVKVLGLPLGGEAAVRRKVLDLLPLAEGDRVLEIGCGTGTVTLMAAARVGRSGRAVGVDPSAEMLARARRKVSRHEFPQVEFLLGPGAPLPFADSSFDAVILFLALHEMAHEDRVDALREGVRVLKPGGHLLVGELHGPDSPVGAALLRLLLLVEEDEARDFFDRGLAAIIAEACGTALAEVTRVTFAMGLGQGVLYVREPTPPPLFR